MAECVILSVAPGLVQLTIDLACYPSAAPILAELGIILAKPNCQAGTEIVSVWRSPRDWLLICNPEISTDLAQTCRSALTDVTALANVVSAGFAVFDISGPKSAAVLAGGTGIDLDSAAFPQGTTSMTRFGETHAMLIHRANAPDSYRLLVDRSRAAHMTAWFAYALADGVQM